MIKIVFQLITSYSFSEINVRVSEIHAISTLQHEEKSFLTGHLNTLGDGFAINVLRILPTLSPNGADRDCV